MTLRRAIILHIGETKTGSTALQRALAPFAEPDPVSGLYLPPGPDGARVHHALSRSLHRAVATLRHDLDTSELDV